MRKDYRNDPRYNIEHYSEYIPSDQQEYPESGTFGEKCKWFFTTKYFINLMISILYTIVMIIITSFILVIAYYRRPPSPPLLPDVFHEAVDFVPGVAAVNVMMSLMIATGVIQLLWPLRIETLAIIRRTLFVYSTVMIFRDLTTVFTNLPDPSPLCQPKEYVKLDFSVKSLLHRLLGGVTCGDMIFSGHTTALLIPTLVVHHYYDGWLTYVLWIMTIFAAFIIVFSRLHYTVDVILSFIIFPAYWYLYHAIAEHPEAFAYQLPTPIRWFFEKMEWSCPYYPVRSEDYSGSDNEEV